MPKPETPDDKSTAGIRGLGDAIGSNFDPIAIAKVVLTLDNASSEMLKKFGQGQAMADLLRGSMADAVTSVRKLGGDIADVLATQKDASDALGRNVVLSEQTTKDLYAKFSPVVQQSIGKVGADTIWNTIISKYNNIPFVNKVNPDITDYVTNKSMDGVFKMISVEEKNIRTDLKSRTSPLLQSVFGLLNK